MQTSQTVKELILPEKGCSMRGSTRGLRPFVLDRIPAKACITGVCAAKRQLFRPLCGRKSEELASLSKKSADFFDRLKRFAKCKPLFYAYYRCSTRSRISCVRPWFQNCVPI